MIAAGAAEPLRERSIAKQTADRCGNRFRRSIGHYRRFYEACRAGDSKAAQSVIHDSMQWAVDLIWDELPSERE